MKIIQRTDAQPSGNLWVTSLIKHVGLHIDGKTLTVRITNAPEHDIFLKLIKVLYGGKINGLDPAQMNGVTVKMEDDPQAPDDLVVRINWDNYSGPGGGLGGLLGIIGLDRSSPNLGDFTFHDWKTNKAELAWTQDALEFRLHFENKAGAQLTYDVCGTGVHIEDLVITIGLIPYVFWSVEVEPRLDKKGLPASGYWLSGKNIYKHRSAVTLKMSFSSISPKQAGSQAKGALGGLGESMGGSLEQAELFRYVEALFIKENDLSSLIAGPGEPSRLRGIHIVPGLAQFLYFDEEDEATAFYGHGRIAAVRKDRINASLLPPSETGPGTGSVHDYRPDNIIEVEVLKDDGKRVRISTLNLVRSILVGQAQIDGVHVVLRDRVWGEVDSELNRQGEHGWVYSYITAAICGATPTLARPTTWTTCRNTTWIGRIRSTATSTMGRSILSRPTCCQAG